MTDINGVPIVPIEGIAANPVKGIAIAAVPITLEGDQEVFELKLRAPGFVRACSIWMREPNVIASAMRNVQPVPQPLLLVECDPQGELRSHRFVFVASDRIVTAQPGFVASWRATALLSGGAGHLFELVEAPS